MFVLIISYVCLVFVIPVTLSLVVSYRALPMGRRCAQCGGETLQLQAPVLHSLSSLHPGVVLHRRWCLGCGWDGLTRLRPNDVLLQPGPLEPTSARPLAKAPTQTLDVRSVTVDGRPFRVMLQCWTHPGGFYGRLVFVSPSGRLWLDAIEALSGRNQNEVLGQALSLPEGLLENRLRRLVSDR